MFSSIFYFIYFIFFPCCLFSQVTCRLHFSIPILNKGLGWVGGWHGFFSGCAELSISSFFLICWVARGFASVLRARQQTGLPLGSAWGTGQLVRTVPGWGGRGLSCCVASSPFFFLVEVLELLLSCAPGPQRPFRDLPGRSLMPPCVHRVLALSCGRPELCVGSAGSACSPLPCGTRSGPLLALSRGTPGCLQHRRGGEEGSAYSSPAQPSFGLVME